MPLKFNKLTLALALTLTTAFSANLDPVQAQIEPPTQEGYYYFPPHQFKNWSELTPPQQKKAVELGYNRDAFSKWLSQQPNSQKWGESMGYTQKLNK
ncbi:hypothetical protein [Sulfurospirillum sp. MES]|uniref:hypothetical protein n=1 Tax=Sulfurospirillum sp. MES TaxID=1565314 RepID=UPI00054286E0|nr:hypothetical protein [Sulfurospirillum sp. MES]KHG32966.1 MAG: hypothetical protein OA34_12260 [Sulfurospirillum sp. MES]